MPPQTPSPTPQQFPQQSPQQPPVAPQTPPQPNQPIQPASARPKTNTLAIIGLILAFLIAPIGLILSIVALSQIKKRQEGGKGLAIAGVIISAINLVFGALLSMLFLMTLSGVQQQARDVSQTTNVNAVHSELEFYYSKASKYPTFEELNSSSWRQANLSDLDPAAITSSLVTTPAAGSIAYEVTGANGQTCDNKTVACTSYTLTVILEDGSTFQKQDLN